MFGEEFTDIPIVQVSIDGSLDPQTNWQIGKVVAALRYAEYCVIFSFRLAYRCCIGRREY
jgi:aromatic ring-opening dioxygenase catalytic subunit (LigB family)